MAAACAADTVAAGLTDRATLAETLGALEGRGGGGDDGAHDAELALAAAPALVDAMCALTAESTESPEATQRAALVLLDLLECAPVGAERDAVYGAAWGAGRFAAHRSALRARWAAPGYALAPADAACYACTAAPEIHTRGMTAPMAAAGMTTLEYFGHLATNLFEREDTADRMATLLLELMREQRVPDGAAVGAWRGLDECMNRRDANLLAGSDIFSLAAAQLSAIGAPADCLSISRGKGAVTSAALNVLGNVIKKSSGQSKTVAVAAFEAAGLFDFCVSVVTAFAEAGSERIGDVSIFAVYAALSRPRELWKQPGCADKIRGMAAALSFCLQPANDLVYDELLGLSTGANAAKLCAIVFGRDEGGSEFEFSQAQVAGMLNYWSQCVRGVGLGMFYKPSSIEIIQVLELSISDANKP